MVGHIKIDRKILNWGWYTDHKTFHLFLYLLLKANWKDGNWKGNEIKRGQLITGRLKMSADTGLSEREIRTSLKRLATTKEITQKTTSKFSIITICKYDVYQSFESQNDQQPDQQTTSNLTNKRPANDQQTTIKNNIINKEGNKKEFNTFPLPENFNGLPEIKIGSVVQLFKITKQVEVSNEDVKGLWEIFKEQSLTGKKYYGNEDEVYSHFISWSKFQKIEKNGGQAINGSGKSGGSKKGGTSSDRMEAARNW